MDVNEIISLYDSKFSEIINFLNQINKNFERVTNEYRENLNINLKKIDVLENYIQENLMKKIEEMEKKSEECEKNMKEKFEQMKILKTKKKFQKSNQKS